MTLEQESRAEGVRYIEEPSSIACFRSVTRIHHLPDGVLLERDGRRDSLIPDVDLVDAPASDSHRSGGGVVLETETTVTVTEESGLRKVTEFDGKIML